MIFSIALCTNMTRPKSLKENVQCASLCALTDRSWSIQLLQMVGTMFLKIPFILIIAIAVLGEGNGKKENGFPPYSIHESGCRMEGFLQAYRNCINSCGKYCTNHRYQHTVNLKHTYMRRIIII